MILPTPSTSAQQGQLSSTETERGWAEEADPAKKQMRRTAGWTETATLLPPQRVPGRTKPATEPGLNPTCAHQSRGQQTKRQGSSQARAAAGSVLIGNNGNYPPPITKTAKQLRRDLIRAKNKAR